LIVSVSPTTVLSISSGLKPGTDAFASRPDDPGAAKVDATKFEEAIKSIDEFTK